MPGLGFSVPPATRAAGASLQEMSSVTLHRKLSQRLRNVLHIPGGPNGFACSVQWWLG